MSIVENCMITARVSASTSNLGAGFDCLGLAVDLQLKATFVPGGDGLRVEHHNCNPADSRMGSDLVSLTLAQRLRERWGMQANGLLVVESTIPVGKGLGSSAAAIVAGLAVADAAAEQPGPNASSLFESAALLEGHTDNVAAAVFGGLVATTGGTDTPQVFRLRLSPSIGFAFVAPSAAISTNSAREVLPLEVPHVTAVRALGRMAALMHGLATADVDAIRRGCEDELHVPFRLQMIPGGAAAIAGASEAGAWGATISGSGSGVIALCSPDRVRVVAAAMVRGFETAGEDAVAIPLRPDYRGVSVEIEPRRMEVRA